jgi:hypothetical protein
MEIGNNEIGEATLKVPAADQEAEALDIIRTETVLSRLPIHNLAKKGNVNIQILKTTPDGKVELKWIVSYSDRYGQARQLAYKLDTIVINHHIDEQGRPLPKMICLGSLRDVADQLDLGGDTNKVRRALRQNASAFITAKFEYRGNDGSKRTLEADFTRYSVVFTGEQLPDGRRADAVYIILNEPYREVLNNAPIRPLDRAYMKALPPAAQRFYEIISYKIFSAIKNNYPRAKITYSEYCTFSAQLRHFERQPVQDQMAKVLRPHKASGYITGVKYVPTIDAQNQPDWIMFLTPGPKAHAEFALAHGGRKARRMIDADANAAGDQTAKRRRAVPPHLRVEQPAPPSFDPQLVTEFSRRGITEKKAHALLANLKPGQAVLAQLELGDHHISKDPGKYTNPAGFYIHLVEENTPIPIGFETNFQRRAREDAERRREDERRAQQELEYDYEDYRNAEIDCYIETLDPAEIAALQDVKLQEMREKHNSPLIVESFAKHEVRREFAKRAPLMTIDAFAARRRQGIGVTAEPATEAASLPADQAPQTPAAGDGLLDATSETAAVNAQVPAEEREAAIEPPAEAATNPAISDPATPLASYPPPPEPGGASADSRFA